MNKIEQEIDNISEKMEKSVKAEETTRALLMKTVLELGPTGLKKALPTLSQDQKELLKSIMSDMKKIKDTQSLEPDVNTTPMGDAKYNSDERQRYDARDEELVTEAEKRRQMSHRNQGGNPIEGWEGQIIKADEMSEKQDAHEKAEDKELKKIKASEKKLEEGQEKVEKGADGGGDYGVDGDNMMKNLKKDMKVGKEMELCKKDHEHGPECMVDENAEKKALAKANVSKMMKRMQERKMEKSVCISALAKNLGATQESVAKAWDAIAKSEKYKYDDGTVGENISEGEQSDVPELMKKDVAGAVHDEASPEVPAYHDKAAKKAKAEKPMSGKEKEEADEMTREVPETMSSHKDMKKSYFHQEDEVYASRKNPLLTKSLTYSVDKFIEESEVATKNVLAKSTFMYLPEEETLAKAMKREVVAGNPGQLEMDESSFGPEEASEQSRLPEWMDHKHDAKHLKECEEVHAPVDEMMKSHYPDDLSKAYIGFKNLAGKLRAKGKVGNPDAVAAAIGRKKYGKAKFNEAAHAGHKMGSAPKKFKKSDINDMIENKEDMDDLSHEAKKAPAEKMKEAKKIKMAKSFSDVEMESLFAFELEKAKKVADEKAEKEEAAKKKKELKKDWMY